MTEPTLTLGIQTYRLTHRHVGQAQLRYALYLASALWAISVLDGRSRADVIHAHVFRAGVPAVMYGRLRRKPVVVTEHSSAFALGSLGWTDRAKARFGFYVADRVLPVSVALRDTLAIDCGLTARYEVVPNVVDPERFYPRTTSHRSPPYRLVCVGTISAQKGTEDLLRALAELKTWRTDWTLDLYGDGELRVRLEALAVELGIASQVRFLGWRPKAEVAAGLRQAAVLVHPSHYETQGCVLLEAAATGLPVLARRVGAIPEVVLPGTGILVPPADPVAFAHGLREILAGLSDFSTTAIRESSERYWPDHIGQRFVEIYEKCLAERHRNVLNGRSCSLSKLTRKV